MYRLFTAIAIPQPQRHELMALMGGLPYVRWQTEDQLHLTLRFIGEVDEAKAEEIQLLLATIRYQPFPIRIQGIGIFGSRRKARMVYAGIEGGQELKALYEKISNVLRRAGFGPEERKFKPHVTLARVKGDNGPKLHRYVEHHAGLALPAFEATRFTLFQSHLGHTGAHYRIIQEYPAAQ